MVQATDKQVEVEGGVIAYEVVKGDERDKRKEETIVCLPGIGDTKREYERFVPALVDLGYN